MRTLFMFFQKIKKGFLALFLLMIPITTIKSKPETTLSILDDLNNQILSIEKTIDSNTQLGTNISKIFLNTYGKALKLSELFTLNKLKQNNISEKLLFMMLHVATESLFLIYAKDKKEPVTKQIRSKVEGIRINLNNVLKNKYGITKPIKPSNPISIQEAEGILNECNYTALTSLLGIMEKQLVQQFEKSTKEMCLQCLSVSDLKIINQVLQSSAFAKIKAYTTLKTLITIISGLISSLDPSTQNFINTLKPDAAA